MRNRNILFIAVGLFIVLVMGVGAYLATPSSTTPTPTTYAKAVNTPTTAACLAENTALNIPSNDRSTVEMATLSYLIDVPAGTNVDVKIASYSNDTVTGSDRYPAKYGNYNFVMNKQHGSWAITDFKHCI